MGARVLVDDDAVDRLASLGLTAELLERVVRRADADASTCTPLDPPIMAGLTRWARTNRYLREELIPAGWRKDDPRNLPRTINPSAEFAIVATSGDEETGLVDGNPTTKYAKGIATAAAVESNQLALDFGDFDLFSTIGEITPGRLRTWFLLFYVRSGGIQVELSLPDGMADGAISSWAERIVLPVLPRDGDALELPVTPSGGDDRGDDSIVVEVSRR